MNLRYREVSNTVLWFVGQCIVLLFCIAYINFIYFDNIYPDKHVKESFIQTECTVVTKQLTTHGRILRHYRADFLLSYNVNGRFYQSVATGNGLDQTFVTDANSQQDMLDQYNVNEEYLCWYNPAAPQIVVLVLRQNWASTFPLVIPAIIALIMMYYLGRSLFIFFGTIGIRTREKIKQKRAPH